MSDNKILVAYFSCSGQTRRLASTIAESAGADVYEIKAETEYTSADLNWNDKKSRSTIEMNDVSSRPGISRMVDNMEQYDTIFVGFPIWWYDAPRIIATFLESYDFSGKTVIPFATSGGSGMGNINGNLKSLCSKETKWKTGRKLNSFTGKNEINKWIEELNI